MLTDKEIRELEAIVMANARRLIKAKKITSNGRLYAELFGTGRTTAGDRCRNELGIDPDGNETSFSNMIEFINAEDPHRA